MHSSISQLEEQLPHPSCWMYSTARSISSPPLATILTPFAYSHQSVVYSAWKHEGGNRRNNQVLTGYVNLQTIFFSSPPTTNHSASTSCAQSICFPPKWLRLAAKNFTSCSSAHKAKTCMGCYVRYRLRLHGNQAAEIESSRHFGRTERFDGGSHLDVHHPKPAAISQRSQSISLGAGGTNQASPLHPPRAPSQL